MLIDSSSGNIKNDLASQSPTKHRRIGSTAVKRPGDDMKIFNFGGENPLLKNKGAIFYDDWSQ